MSKKGNHGNIAAVKKWLDSNDIEYTQLNEYHFRILGPSSLVDLWPTRMTYHVIESEKPVSNKYSRLRFNFDPEDLKAIL